MANKIYLARETTITIADSTQTPTEIITLSALGATSGRQSDDHDFGTGSKPGLFWWQATFQFASAPTVGDVVELYLAFSQDGTDFDAGLSTLDASLAADARRNMQLFGTVVAQAASSNTDFRASGLVFIPTRYIILGVYNASSVALRTDTSVHHVKFTPIPSEIQ